MIRHQQEQLLDPVSEVKALKINEKYEAESSMASKNYKKGSEGFPFTSDQLLNHVRENIERINDDDSTSEKVFYSKVRGVFLYGSRVFNTNVNDSDFDLLFIADDLKSSNSPEGGYARNTQYNLHSVITVLDSNGESVSYELEVMMMNTTVLLGYSHSHLPVILLSVQQPYEKFVVFEDSKMKNWRENWNRWFFRLPRSRNSILHELNFSFNKAHRFWVGLQKGQYVTEKEKKDALKKVKKNLAHGIRFCKYGYQIAFGGCIYDYLETNQLYDEVVYGTDNYQSWEEYEALVKHLYDRWMVEFKEDIKAVMRESRKQCLSMTRSSNLVVVDFLNKFVPTFSKESTFVKRDYENISLSFGPFSLHRVFAIDVTPVFKEADEFLRPNECTLFKLDIDGVFQEAENSLSFREMNLFLECNGTIIEVAQIDNTTQYYPVCVPRFLSEEYHNLDKRFGDGYSKNLRLSDFSIFENPSGARVNLYYHSNEWKFSFDNESQMWQNEWILDKTYTNELSNDFLKLWEKLEMKKPMEQHTNFTFFFTYQIKMERIFYCGCRNLDNMKEESIWRDFGDQYNWLDQVKQMFFESVEEMKDTINDFNQYPPICFEGFECINFNDNYRSFKILSDLRSSIPHLRITNTNYVVSLLDEEIISDPPFDLIDSKHNYDTLICIIVRSKFSEIDGDEQVVADMNRIFLKAYSNLKHSYLSLVKNINEFYSNNLLQYEEQASEFQERSKLYMDGRVKKANQLFASFLRTKKKTGLCLSDFSLYWKGLSAKRDNASDLRFIKQLIDINK